MKFCKSLQKVVEISDPAYSAFFVNYRMLSKFDSFSLDGKGIDQCDLVNSLTWYCVFLLFCVCFCVPATYSHLWREICHVERNLEGFSKRARP